MKRGLIIFLFLIVIFSSFVSASSVGLVESEVWQSNITGSVNHNSAVFGDIDNDGDLDFITIGCTVGSSNCIVAGTSLVFINNGTSFVQNSTWQRNISKMGATSISLGDIDNDGDLDLVFGAGFHSNTSDIYTNNGTAFISNLTWQIDIIADDAGSNSAALGDIDNDGDLDLIYPDSAAASRVYINNGTTFVRNLIWGQDFIRRQKISTGLIDLDNDGDLDLSVLGQSASDSYINNGTSLVIDSNWDFNSGDEANAVWGDYDNDGDMDFIIGLSSATRFGINNGSQYTNGDSQWDFQNGLTTINWGSMMLGDYTNNGYLDLVSFGLSGGDNIDVAENNGSTFVRDALAESNLTGGRKASALWGDIDNDGDLDLVIPVNNKVYINNNTVSNTAPTAPASFSSSYNNREISIGWLNGSDAETNSTGLYYNLKLGTLTENHSIISGVYGGQGDGFRGGTAFGYFGNMMQRKNFTLNVDRLEPSTKYWWSVQTIDTGLKAGSFSGAQSFTTPGDLTKPTITLNSPVDNFNSSSFSLTFNATVTDANLSSVSLWGNWTGTFQINETNSSGLNGSDYIFTKSLTGYGEGKYKWLIEATDNETNAQNSSTRTFIIDTTNPSLYIKNPLNQTYTTAQSLLNYTVSDSGVGLDTCRYSTDNGATNNTVACGTNVSGLSSSQGQNTWIVYVNDSSGNSNTTSVSFFVDSINPLVNYSPTTETNNSNISQSFVFINASYIETNPSNITFRIF